MEKCSPIEMRKNLQVVDMFVKPGLDYIAVPVRDINHKNELIALSNDVLEEFVNEDKTK